MLQLALRIMENTEVESSAMHKLDYENSHDVVTKASCFAKEFHIFKLEIIINTLSDKT